jgi:hypothetical protein
VLAASVHFLYCKKYIEKKDTEVPFFLGDLP